LGVTKVRDQRLLISLGKSVRKRRKEKKLSQDDLAYQAEIPLNQIGRIERGEINPSLSTLNSIAKALRINLSQLLNEL
jgi:transcriptional regulator with XRE-family HTH domain